MSLLIGHFRSGAFRARRLTACFVLLLTCLFATVAAAQEDAVPQDWSGIFPAPAQLGYTPDSFDLVFTWSEVASNDRSQEVSGYRLVPRDGADAFDLYFDASGALLDSGNLAALGIVEKKWSATPVSRPAEIIPGFPLAAARQTLAPTPAPGSPALELTLPPFPLEEALIEDLAGVSTPHKGVARIGGFVDLAVPVAVNGNSSNTGRWETDVDGVRTWRLTLRSLDAEGLRLHFDEVRIPEGGRLLVYSTNDPRDVHGPITNGEDLWTPTCFGEALTVECRLPADSPALPLSIVIDRVAHQYRSLEEVVKAAGTCNLDVPCFPEWNTTALGVGGIGTIGSTGTLWCTGSLLADGDPATAIPYFLTANHCVGSSRTADSLEVYWLYDAASCGGSAPSPSSVPRTTGGAEFLAGSSDLFGSDVTLMQLRNDPPTGLTFLGFSTIPPAVGEAVVCLHHPRGDYKRISFGSITDAGSPIQGRRLKPISRFHEVLWQEATTEPGSSGSPLFRENDGLIIGQLYGGFASCSLRSEPDYYGRFDVSYAVLEPWLARRDSPYDVDKSGVINAVDIQLVVNVALGRISLAAADVNGSGAVDAVDLQLVVETVLNPNAL